MKCKKHLTLMETIALMVIIIVLVTIFLPAIMHSREWAKSVKCKANMKTISDGIFAYAAGSNGCLPSPVTGASWRGFSWTYYLWNQGYVPAPKRFAYTWYGGQFQTVFFGYPLDYSSVWACPSQEIAPQNRFLTNIVAGNPDYNPGLNGIENNTKCFFWHSCHYDMNLAFVEYSTNPRYIQQFTAKKGKSLSQLGLLMDGIGGISADTNGYQNGSPTVWNYRGCQVGSNLIWVRHFGNAYGVTSANYANTTYLEIGPGQINTIYLDGHAEYWTNKIWWNKYCSKAFYPFSR